MDFNLVQKENCFDKFIVEASEIKSALKKLRDNAVYDFDRLNTIIAVDLGAETSKIELIYDLYSTKTNSSKQVSTFVARDNSKIESVTDIYKSAYFDECEIYDMFGVTFDKNPNLKRLLMPSGWVGYPLKKDYKQDDERLTWNE